MLEPRQLRVARELFERPARALRREGNFDMEAERVAIPDRFTRRRLASFKARAGLGRLG